MKKERLLYKMPCVVAGGRGVCTQRAAALLMELADLLDAGVAATRAGVESGYFREDQMVGLSGRRIAPCLYMAFGVSGANFHMIGIKNAKYVFAVNIDKDAPIFQRADMEIVGDTETILKKILILLKDYESLWKKDNIINIRLVIKLLLKYDKILY